MFIGHFAIALRAKRIAPQTALGTQFVACQLLDLIWPILVLAGIEVVKVDHTATAFTPLDFAHYPYSHSLGMALIFSVLFGVIVGVPSKSRRAGITTGGVVLSHWLLDFITHRPDLSLWFGSEKVGLGLWEFPALTVLVEGALFVIGIGLYLKSSPLQTRRRKIIFWSLIGFLGLAYAGNVFGPKPPPETSGNMIAGPALAMWLIVAWGYWVDRKHINTKD